MHNRKLLLVIGAMMCLLLILEIYRSYVDDIGLENVEVVASKDATGYFAKRHDIHYENVTTILKELVLAPGSKPLTHNSNAKKQHVFTSSEFLTNESCIAVVRHFRKEFMLKNMTLNKVSERDAFTSADTYFYCIPPYLVTLAFQQQRHFSEKEGCNYSLGVSWNESPFSDCKK